MISGQSDSSFPLDPAPQRSIVSGTARCSAKRCMPRCIISGTALQSAVLLVQGPLRADWVSNADSE